MEPRCFQLTMDSNVEDMVVGSAMVRGLLDQLHVRHQDADMVELCLMEALVNAVRHAYRDESGQEVQLRVELGSSSISFEVVDSGLSTTREALGKAVDKALRFDPRNLDTLLEGGRGMLIIAQGMDEWDYFRRGESNVLRMRKSFGSDYKAPGS